MPDVLIVDDEEDICDCLKSVIEDLGCTAKSVMTGDQAIQILDTEDFRVFVVDLKLSTSVTGLDVIRAIRTKKPAAVIVAMSGYIDIGLKQEAEHLKVSDYLEKPGHLKQEVFAKRIKALLTKGDRQ